MTDLLLGRTPATSPARRRLRTALSVVAAVLALGAGCSHVGDYVWVQAYDSDSEQKTEYVITRGDVIQVRVWNQESISGRIRVRSDGMISLPFINDIRAAGVEPAKLAQLIQVKLQEFILNPSVTVSVEEPAPLEVSVIGEVARPGVYRLERDPSVLKALATAGGLTMMAGRDRIFVLRAVDTDKSVVRIRFSYQDLAHAEGHAARFRLRSDDVVVVE